MAFGVYVRFQRQGTAVPCYVSMLLDDAALESKDQSVDSQRDFDIRWTANSLYAGESPPVLFSSSSFFLRLLAAAFANAISGRFPVLRGERAVSACVCQ